MSVPHDAEATALCLRTSRSKASRLILSPRIDGHIGAVAMPIIRPMFVQLASKRSKRCQSLPAPEGRRRRDHQCELAADLGEGGSCEGCREGWPSLLFKAQGKPTQAFGVALREHGNVATLLLSSEGNQPIDILWPCDLILLDLDDEIADAQSGLCRSAVLGNLRHHDTLAGSPTSCRHHRRECICNSRRRYNWPLPCCRPNRTRLGLAYIPAEPFGDLGYRRTTRSMHFLEHPQEYWHHSGGH
jgi:hypothetical protein